MDDIKRAIELLSKHKYRSTSNVVGEYVERLVASSFNGDLAKYCQKGFDVLTQELGKIEVKSRNYYAKSYRCTLPERKLKEIDNFILVIVKDGNIERALLFTKKVLASIKLTSSCVFVDKNNFDLAEDITAFINESYVRKLKQAESTSLL